MSFQNRQIFLGNIPAIPLYIPPKQDHHYAEISILIETSPRNNLFNVRIRSVNINALLKPRKKIIDIPGTSSAGYVNAMFLVIFVCPLCRKELHLSKNHPCPFAKYIWEKSGLINFGVDTSFRMCHINQLIHSMGELKNDSRMNLSLNSSEEKRYTNNVLRYVNVLRYSECINNIILYQVLIVENFYFRFISYYIIYSDFIN